MQVNKIMEDKIKMGKYLNEAIIGNRNMLVTYTQKGELQRMYYPAKDNR